MYNFDRYINLALKNKDRPVGSYKHFSFIVCKNEILSMGWNNVKKTHPLALKNGYAFPFIHSELDAIIKFDEPLKKLRYCSIINVRLTKTNKVTLSRPCKNCQGLLLAFGVKEILYSNELSKFERFNF
jgi:deoxycytidylate deaminase